MPREIVLDGIFVPSLLIMFVLSLGCLMLFDRIAGRYGFYRYVWHPTLFRLALFVCIFAGISLRFY